MEKGTDGAIQPAGEAAFSLSTQTVCRVHKSQKELSVRISYCFGCSGCDWQLVQILLCQIHTEHCSCMTREQRAYYASEQGICS